jgi:GT2 family glycosyltransferase
MTVSIATNVTEAAAQLADAPSPIVIITVYDAYEDVVCCLEAVTAHTGPEVAVLVVDDGGSDRRVFTLLRSLADGLAHHVVVLQRERNGGFVRACNDAFAATAGRDVVLVNSDVVVGPEWLERLTAAALSLDTIATASTLTNNGTILSVPHRNRPATTLLEGLTPDDAARRVAAASRQLRPTIPTAIGHCFYIRRRALDLVGPFDVEFDPGYGEEVDFSQRALAHGFRHIVADDVFTFHRGGRSFGESPAVTARRQRHHKLIEQRYPWYGPASRRASADHASQLADALGTARRALVGLVVGVDGLSLGPYLMGTQRIVVESIRALARRKEIARLVVFVPPGIPPYVEELRSELPLVEFIGLNPFMGIPDQLVDIVYRPCQISQLVDLDFLSRVGERFVVNQLDTIAFENPAYFESDAAWVAYRDLTRLTLELADGVALLSERSRQGVAAEGLLPRDTPTAVVSCGTVTVRARWWGSTRRTCCASARRTSTRTAGSRWRCSPGCVTGAGTGRSCCADRRRRTATRSRARPSSSSSGQTSDGTCSRSARCRRRRSTGSTVTPPSCCTPRRSKASGSCPSKRPDRGCLRSRRDRRAWRRCSLPASRSSTGSTWTPPRSRRGDCSRTRTRGRRSPRRCVRAAASSRGTPPRSACSSCSGRRSPGHDGACS